MNTTKESNSVIKAMTLNTQCWNVTETRLVNLPAMVRKYMPDLLGVQEATPRWMSTLRDALPEYEGVGVGRNADLGGEHSAVFFRKDKFTLIKSDTKWLSLTPCVSGSKLEESHYIRVATYAILERKSDKKRFMHLNTHLDSCNISCKQIAIMLELLEEWNTEELPIVLTGDFNFNPDTPNYQMYLDAGFENSLIHAKETSEKTDDTVFPVTTLDGWKFDYIFVKADRFEVSTHRVCTEKINGEYVSDHYPVYAEITLL